MEENEKDYQELNQMKKGILNIVVLKTISEGNTYGYEMIMKIDKKSNGLFKMKEGTLYPILYRLEEKGYIISAWNVPDKEGKPKKYYSLTTDGKDKLDRLGRLWAKVVNTMDSFIER